MRSAFRFSIGWAAFALCFSTGAGAAVLTAAHEQEAEVGQQLLQLQTAGSTAQTVFTIHLLIYERYLFFLYLAEGVGV